MKKSLLTIIQYFFFLGLGILFVWLTIKDITPQQWQHIKSSLLNARHWLIAPVVILLFISHYSRALRWKILMQPLGYNPSTFNTFAAVMIGYLVNAGVPRLGEVVKCTILSRYEKVRADNLIGTIVIERIVDLICLITIFIIALLTQGHIIGNYVYKLFAGMFTDDAGNFSFYKIAFTLFIFFAFLLLFYIILKRFGHIDAVGKIKKLIKGIVSGLGSIRYIRQKGWFIFHTILIWSLYLASTTLGITALQETKHLGLAEGITTLAVGSVGMIVTPGGIGAYPFLVEKLLILYNIQEETGTALGWLLWTVQTLIILVAGLIFTGLISFYNKNKNTVANGEQYSK